jgi:hypothetical protein
MGVPAPTPDAFDEPEKLDVQEERVVRDVLLRMNARSVAIASGLLFGLGLFAATNFLILRGGENVGAHLRLLAVYFPGYGMTFTGSLIGFAYAFVLGYIVGRTVAFLYNRFVDL